MSAILFGQLLFITAESICFSTSYIVSSMLPQAKFPPVVNLCQYPCSLSCSPHCLSACCVAKSVLPNFVPPASSPVGNAASFVSQPKQDLVISSVEEGDTEECGDYGIGSPTDNRDDPPGTITIPLPPTMYTPPKPGEQPKEMPLPDFKLPASILQGIPPSKSITLTPLGTPMPSPASSNSVGYTPPSIPSNSVGYTPPSIPSPICSPAPPTLSLPPKPVMTKLPPITVSEIPCKITPHVPPAGNTLSYPKLPPITISEIPGKIPLPIPIGKQVSPYIARLPLPPRPSVLYTPPPPPPPPLLTKLPPVIPAENKLSYPSPCPLHCLPECRDDCCTIRLGAPSPGTVPEAPVTSDPAILEIDPTVISLPAAPACSYNKYDNKPVVDHHVIKEMNQQLNSRYA